MNIHRIYGIVLRHLYLFKNEPDALVEPFLTPTIELLVWGLTSLYIQSFSHSSNIVLIILSGVLLWVIVTRGNNEVAFGLMSDIWSKNLINIFVSPLKFSEWVTALLCLGFIKAGVSFTFAMIVAFVLYKTNLFAYGFYLIPFMLMLLMTGWTVGFFASGLILRYGSKYQVVAWVIISLIAPFSAIYYPISILPWWAQYISLILPTSYIFEGARQIVLTGHMDIAKLYMSFLLNCIYLSLAIMFLRHSFKKLLERGLLKVF